MSNTGTGIAPPRRSESLESVVIRILREFSRPVPFSLVAQLSEEPEDVVYPIVSKLIDDNRVRSTGEMLELVP